MRKTLYILVFLIFIGAVIWFFFKYFSDKKSLANNTRVNEIVRNGVLKVGTDASFYPMEFIDKNGRVVGFGPDLAMEIAKSYGVPLKMVNIPWDNLFTELKHGSVDMVISSVSITLERSKTMSFSKPYFSSGQVIAVLKNNNLIKNLTDLKGKRIGLQSGTTSEEEALKLTSRENTIGFENYDLAFEALLSKNIDAVIMDYIPALEKVKNSSNLKLVGGPFTQEFYGVVVSKGKESLLIPVNGVINRMAESDDLKKLEKKWLK